jgi:hypothetical protein
MQKLYLMPTGQYSVQVGRCSAAAVFKNPAVQFFDTPEELNARLETLMADATTAEAELEIVVADRPRVVPLSEA